MIFLDNKYQVLVSPVWTFLVPLKTWKGVIFYLDKGLIMIISKIWVGQRFDVKI